MSARRATKNPLQDSPDSAARLAAYLSPAAPEVFGSVVYQQQIWLPDPFDVHSIHNEARDAFESLLQRAAKDPPPEHGRILLLHGEAGSGKTHLMRAFRQMTHQTVCGYFCYMQMTTEAGNYGKYLLRNFINSLEQPFLLPQVDRSGLMRLSDGVLECVPGLEGAEIDAFKDGSLECDPARRAFEYADHAVKDPRLCDCDIDVMRALIHLQRGDPRVKARVIKWLRCEDLPPSDRTALGDLVPRTEPEDPIRMVEDLARIMWCLYHAPLVVCVDQLEDVFQQQESDARFRRAVDTVIALADRIRSSVSVVSCLEDFYVANEKHLTRSKIDRMSRDPAPVRLASGRDEDEVLDLIAARLEHLYESQGVSADSENRTFPFKPESLQALVKLRTRDVLDACQRHHQRCITDGKWSEPDWKRLIPTGGRATDGPQTNDQFEREWNDFRDQITDDIPDDEEGLASLLNIAIAACNEELAGNVLFKPALDGRTILTERVTPTGGGGRSLIAVCEKKAQANGLRNQINDAAQKAGATPLVLVRSTAFPGNPKTEIFARIAKVIKEGGRTIVVENADWRAMLAFRKFHSASGARKGFSEWQRASRPISQLTAIRKILDLDRGEAAGAARTAPAPEPEPAPAQSIDSPPESAQVVRDSSAAVQESEAFRIAPASSRETEPAKGEALAKVDSAKSAGSAPAALSEPAPRPATPLLLGRAKSLAHEDVRIDPLELKMHAAFLGGSGSGKTTAALSLIEQLLLAGVPAILIDRKGDLARYADPAAYATGDPSLFNGRHAERLASLRDRVDVRLYTPGEPRGRALAIPVAPDDLSQLTTADREQTAGYAAAALGAMIGYKGRGTDQKLQVILAKAIEVLAAAAPDRPISVEALRQLVDDSDPSLLNAVGGYEPKHYKRLAEDLLTLKLQNGRLLAAEGDRLDIDALLGRGESAVAGKTRLSIINTQFIGSTGATEFWVTQFLMALDRWRLKSPSDQLQAVVLLDEADLYLPAQSEPSTKAPLASLLRRARSAGLGIFLATQSPGDFDYRCRENIRTWIVGRVKEPVALNKLKPLFADARIDVASRLPTQQTGEFHLLRDGRCISLLAERSLVETRQLPEDQIIALAAR